MSFKPLLQKIDKNIRRITWFARCVPDFVVAGVQKGGTTTLFAYLNKHPQVHMPARKEIHYYDRNFHKGASWYRSHFPLKSSVPKGHKVGEATPCYLYFPHAAKHMHMMNPDTKIIVVLRNPIERAISHYFHNRRKHKEDLDMPAAFLQEERRIARRYKALLQDEHATDWEVAHHGYKARGVYHRQLRRFRSYFPMSQLLILSTDLLDKDPLGAMTKVYEFIGVDPSLGTTQILRKNVGTNKEPVPPEVCEYLRRFFQPAHQAFVNQYGPVYSFP
ncbi:MAG: sulfotransferase domain-containing protein [Verrucomicrobiaceae bacterium]